MNLMRGAGAGMNESVVMWASALVPGGEPSRAEPASKAVVFQPVGGAPVA